LLCKVGAFAGAAVGAAVGAVAGAGGTKDCSVFCFLGGFRFVGSVAAAAGGGGLNLIFIALEEALLFLLCLAVTKMDTVLFLFDGLTTSKTF
jgi:hypothetical protein